MVKAIILVKYITGRLDPRTLQGYSLPVSTDLSPVALRRLVLSRELADQREQRGEESLSSAQIASFLGEDSSLIRKDFRVLDLDTQGRSYRTSELLNSLDRYSGNKQIWALVGMGDLGLHLLHRLQAGGFIVGAVFDAKPNRLDQLDLGVPSYPAYEIPQRLPLMGIRAAILAVPASAVQTTVERLVQGGVKGIVNCSRGLVRQIRGVEVINAGVELQFLLMEALLKKN